MNENKKIKAQPDSRKHKKKFKINIRSMGVSIDKNEYYEIVESNSAHPEKSL